LLTIAICSIDAAKYAQCTAVYRELLRATDHEIIGIHDARSLAEGYNRAVRRAKGDVVVFSHDDVEVVSPDLAGALSRALASLDVVGVAGTSRVVDGYWPRAGQPHIHGWVTIPAPDGYSVNIYGVDAPIESGHEALDGLFFAARRDVLTRIPFDEESFDAFHGCDIDFTFRAHVAGFRVGTSAEIALIHASGGTFDANWARYNSKFVDKHRGRLPRDFRPGAWSLGVLKVATKADIVRDFPLERLLQLTTELRAPRAGTGPGT